MLQNASYRTVLFTFALVTGPLLSCPAAAAGPTTAILSDSIKAVAAVPTTDRNQGWLTRALLTSQEEATPIDFEVSLQIHNYADLQNRVANNEKISAQELAAKYEPSAADYQQVVTWLSSQNLTITQQDAHHLAVFVRGTPAQIKKAMSVNFGRVATQDGEYTSALTAPVVPNWMSSVIVGVNGLQPHIHLHKHAATAPTKDSAGFAGVVYTPAQIAAAYNATPLYNSNINGAGQTIAIIIDTFPLTSDLDLFWRKTGVPQMLSNISFIKTVNLPMGAPTGEETLDTEWSSGMAPGAKVRVYGSTSLAFADIDASYAVLLADVTNHPEYNIQQMSMSFGLGEQYYSSAQVTTDDHFFTELTALGVTCFASAGDAGSTPDNTGHGFGGPLEASFPSTDPNVTAVGGTSLRLNTTTNVVISETVWNTPLGKYPGATGGGTSIFFARPSWQVGTGVNLSAMRQVPDISTSADLFQGATLYIYGNLYPEGGTSWSCPTCAGLCALMNEARATAGETPLGLLGPEIYPLLGTNSFRDITVGNNATPNSGGLYKATVGYDEASGLGAPLISPMTEQLTGNNPLIGVSSSPPVVEVAPNQVATFSVGATGSSTSFQWQEMPLGSMTWTNLTDGTPFSGTGTATLTVNPVTESLSGDQFRCMVVLTASTVFTNPSTLVVDYPLQVSTLAGRSPAVGLNNGAGKSSTFRYPSGTAVDAVGNIFVADTNNNVIRKITPAGVVSTAYGSLGGTAGTSDGTGNAALFYKPVGLAFDPFGNLFVTDAGSNFVGGSKSVRKISNGVVSTVATFFPMVNEPAGVATDTSGNAYVADSGANVIYEITTGDVLSTLAGNGTAGSVNGPASSSEFKEPVGLAVDGSGDVFVADFGNSTIREISGGQVTTIAGTAGQQGYLDGIAASSLFNNPVGLCFDVDDNLYITDSAPPVSFSQAGNVVIRKLSSTGVVSTLAGNPGTPGATDGVGSAAEFKGQNGIAFGGAGNFYIADTYNQTIRQGTPTGKIAATVALGGLATTYDGLPQAVTVTTTPPGLAVTVTYDGSQTAPTNAGSYAVVAEVNDPNYAGLASGTLVIAKETGTVTLGNLNYNYTGLPLPANATTTPAGLTVDFTYNGSTKVPVNDGSYTVVGTINDTNFQGTATGTEVITTGVATITFGPLTFNYTGRPLPVTATTLPRGVAVTVTYNGFSTAPTAVGSYTVAANVSTPGFTGSATATETILPIAPTAATGLPSNITGTSATVSGTVNPNSSDTDVSFQYGLTTAYGSVSGTQDIGSGITPVVTTTTITVPAAPVPRVYHYRVVATSAGGTTVGPDRTFTALAQPSITTAAVPSLSATGAEIGVSVNPNGLGTSVYIKYGLTTAYGSVTSTMNIGNGNKAVNLYFLFPSLPPGTTFDYQVVMTSPAGTFFGPPQSFTTLNFDTTLVAFSGGPAADTTTTYLGFGPPAVNVHDGAAFNATLNGVPTGFNDGIWADDSGGNLHIVTTQGAFAPGTAGAFLTLSDPAYNDNANVAFYGTAVGNLAGIWTNDAGNLSLVALQGTAATGTTGNFATFGSVGLTDSAGVVFSATITGTGITKANNLGIWEGDTAGTLALQVGQTISNKTISTLSFMPALALVNGQTRSFNATGDLACLATFTDKTTGFAEFISNAPVVLTYSGLPADDLAGPTYTGFGNPAINNNDHLAYTATIAGTGVTKANSVGIWADNSSGARTVVARAGTFVAPGTSAVFTAFSDPVINNNEAVAFRGTVALTGATNTGIWATGSNLTSLALVAQAGGAAPGCPGATFSTFSELGLPDQGGVVFLASLTGGGVSGSNNIGVWAVDDTGTLQLIIRTGNILNGKTISSLAILSSPAYVNGQTRSFTPGTGDLVYLATFNDKSTAIFNVVFP